MLDDPFDSVGFLSKQVHPWGVQCRAKHEAWFALIESLNVEGMKTVLNVTQPRRGNKQQLVAALFFGRTLQSVQGAVLLAARGMQAEARTLIRSAVESTIALGAAVDGDGERFMKELVADADRHRLKVMNALLNDPETRAELGGDAPARFELAKLEIRAEHGEQGPAGLNLEALAWRVGMTGIYNTIYREFSGDGAHPTLNALMRHVVIDDDKDIQELAFEPRDDDLESSLSAAASVTLCALEAISRVFTTKDLQDRVKSLATQWRRLCGLPDEVDAAPA